MIGVVGRTWKLLSSRDKLISLTILVTRIASHLFDLIGFAGIALVIALTSGESRAIPYLGEWVEQVDDPLPLALLGTAMVFLLKSILALFLARLTYRFVARVEVKASTMLATWVFSGEISRATKYSKSELDWLLVKSTHLAFGTVLSQAITLISEVALSLLILSVFVFADWQAAISVIVFFSAIMFAFHLSSREKLKRSGKKYSDGSMASNQVILDFVAALREILISAKSQFFLDKFRTNRAAIAKAQATEAYLNIIPRVAVEVGLIVGAIGFYAQEYFRSNGEPRLTILAIFLVGSLRVMSAVLPVQRALMALRYLGPQAEAAQKALHHIGTAIPEIVNLADARDQSSFEGVVSVDVSEASFSYKDNKNPKLVLDKISFEIRPKEFVAFIGHSGAGKSTLVDLLLGLHSPDNGRVDCNGVPSAAFRAAYPGKIGYVPQRPGVVFGTIRENVALGIQPYEIDDSLVWKVLREAKLDQYVAGLPEKLHHVLGRGSDSLSGGQLQRLGIARALYLRPKLLVLDEATSGLDAETEFSISETLSSLRSEISIVVVAHRLSTIKEADVIHLLEGGKILASGRLTDLKKNSPQVARYISLLNIDA